MTPNRKIGASALAGAITVVAVWAVSAFTSVDIPPEVAAAITVILTFVVGYVVPEGDPG